MSYGSNRHTGCAGRQQGKPPLGRFVYQAWGFSASAIKTRNWPISSRPIETVSLVTSARSMLLPVLNTVSPSASSSRERESLGGGREALAAAVDIPDLAADPAWGEEFDSAAQAFVFVHDQGDRGAGADLPPARRPCRARDGSVRGWRSSRRRSARSRRRAGESSWMSSDWRRPGEQLQTQPRTAAACRSVWSTRCCDDRASDDKYS